jgi:hypothetical protein
MKLSEYERSRNPRGMHGWGNLWDRYDAWFDRIAEMKLGWIKTLDDSGDQMYAAARFRERGIMPVVRLYRGEPNPGTLPQYQLNIVKEYVDQNITRWFETNNEPNLDVEWKQSHKGIVQYGAPEIVMPAWLDDAEAVIERGGYPGFPALAPCGFDARHSSILTYQGYFRWLADHAYQRAKTVFENGAWIAIHPYMCNHFYRDDQGEWHFEYPDDPICQADDPGRTIMDDDVSLMCGEVPQTLLRQYFGLEVPLIGTEGGPWVPRPGEVRREDTRYPGNDLHSHAQATVGTFDWIARKAPPYFFGHCVWLLDEYFPGGNPIPAVRALRDTEPVLRPGIVEEEPAVVHYRSHYVLFPQGASWDWYEAASNYLTHFRATLGQSHDDAGVVHGDLGHTITAINPPDDVLKALKKFGATLDVIHADTPEALKKVLDARVEANTRFG